MLLHRYFIRDGAALETIKYQPDTGIEIYEVVRIIRGIPLFLEDHLLRFFHSAWLCHFEIPLEEEEIAVMLEELIRINGVQEGNVRFSYCLTPAGNFQAYFIPHFYPDSALTNQGVSCGVLHAERTDPKAKIVHVNLRERADQLIRQGGFYEVLLLNNQGELTEGSRSNLFFLKNGVFVTASSDAVLPGITRHKVLELIEASGFKPELRNLRIDELPSVEAAFLTGTSPKVLPIRNIEEFIFNTDHAEIRKLIADYDRLIHQYINMKNKMNS
jgi:branched-chain amino acid aminotransferase